MIEKFEIRIKSILHKLGHKNIYLVFFAFFGAITMFSLVMTNNYKRNRNSLMDIYNRSIYELVGYVENLEAYTLKSLIVNKGAYEVTTYSKVATYAGLSKTLVSALPIAQQDIEYVSKFLSQTTGYYTYLVEKVTKGNNIDESDKNNLKEFNKKYIELAKVFKKIYIDLTDGSLKWNEVERITSKKLKEERFKDEDSINLFSISKPFTKYEGLIYDGAFSNHIETATPKLLENANEISKEQGKKNVEEKIANIFLDNNIKEKTSEYEIEDIIFKNEIKGKLELYEYAVKFKNIPDILTVTLTKKGGYIYLLIWDNKTENKDQTEIKMYKENETDISNDNEKAKEYATNFLESIGITNMISTYYTKDENEVLFNFAANMNSCIIYTDLIKVKVNVKTKKITLLECTGYIYNHHKRYIDSNIISKEEIITYLNKDIVIDEKSTKLCIIPNEANKEILCYELAGNMADNKFLIYLNASTGAYENVLILIDNKEHGTLTI